MYLGSAAYPLQLGAVELQQLPHLGASVVAEARINLTFYLFVYLLVYLFVCLFIYSFTYLVGEKSLKQGARLPMTL